MIPVAGSVIANSNNSNDNRNNNNRLNNNDNGNNNRAWKQGQVYEYEIKGRTLAALHDVADQYTGTLIRATLKVQPRNQNSVLAWVTNAKHSDVHANLTNGWKQEIPDKHINYQNWQLSEKPFLIEYKNGVVSNFIPKSIQDS
uniref:Vitellogenin n=1 Tax=Cacopsylla melanoneura TaxID=428564 RepID=A0A8D9FAS7_9HEMI